MKRVHLVDDSFDIRQFMQALLEDDYAFTSFDNPLDALANWQLLQPDLVLLDYSLPVLNGIDVLRRMKSDPKLKHIPAIALTGESTVGMRHTFIDSGFDQFIPKPISDINQLTRAIRDLLHP